MVYEFEARFQIYQETNGGRFKGTDTFATALFQRRKSRKNRLFCFVLAVI
jgi:hypothetical protein